MTTGYTLYLSADEAQVLVDVLANVAGDPKATRRKHTQAVYDALRGVGLTIYAAGRDLTGRLQFTNGDVFDQDRAYTFVKDWSTA